MIYGVPLRVCEHKPPVVVAVAVLLLEISPSDKAATFILVVTAAAGEEAADCIQHLVHGGLGAASILLLVGLRVKVHLS